MLNKKGMGESTNVRPRPDSSTCLGCKRPHPPLPCGHEVTVTYSRSSPLLFAAPCPLAWWCSLKILPLCMPGVSQTHPPLLIIAGPPTATPIFIPTVGTTNPCLHHCLLSRFVILAITRIPSRVGSCTYSCHDQIWPNTLKMKPKKKTFSC